MIAGVAVTLGALLTGCGGASTDASPTGLATRQPCRVGTAACAARIEVVPGRFVRSYQSYPLGVRDTLITSAVIMVHGINRDADAYFATTMTAADLAGRSQTTLVIAPQFITTDEAPAADEPAWTSSGWPRGDLSPTTAALPRLSSFAAVDTIVSRLASRTQFPRLTRITIAGHSAGGQFAHRYAATSSTARTSGGVTVRFVAANPSTWLYLGPERANGSTFTVPDAAVSCPDYDDWQYGLQGRNTYANALPAATVRQQLMQRDVTMLLGTADTLTAELDVSCAANLQGARRYPRGLTLLRYMNALNPGHLHSVVEIPGVGHSSSGMFTSAGGRRALFGD
jgi:pimeloyl-ACP methyl ester carboxylesterase